MPLTVEAIYEDGCLKLTEALPLKEHQKIRVTIPIEPSTLKQAYGIMGWTGSDEVADRFALGNDFDLEDEL